MNSICFDTETTGLHPNGSDPDEILTISIIGRDGSVLLDERFRPTVKTEWPHASAVNGIYPEDVADLPTIETAIPRLREIFAGADEVIGYNVGFDLGFLSAVGVRPREDARITDTMKEFTWFMGRRYKLVDAADHIGYEWTGRAHGSLADALATLAVQRWLELMRIFRSREDGMRLRGDSVREIPFMLFLGLLFAVTVGWWVFLTLTVSVVFGNVAAAVFAVCSALSVTVGYGLVRASDSRE